MLSYQHSDQKLVSYVYEFLTQHQIRTWMDIQGGMEEHILDRYFLDKQQKHLSSIQLLVKLLQSKMQQ